MYLRKGNPAYLLHGKHSIINLEAEKHLRVCYQATTEGKIKVSHNRD